MKDQARIAPRVAFVVNLEPLDAPSPNLARLRHLVHLFRGHRVAATWAVADASQARLLRDSSSSSAGSEMALMIDRNWAAVQTSRSRFADELRDRLASLADAVGAMPSTVAGEIELLRSRIVSLSDQGIRAILASCPSASFSGRSRPLPCGLWHLVPNASWPKRRLSRWLPSRPTSVRELISRESEGVILVSIESAKLKRAGARGLQSFEKLLREVSWSASRGQMQISTLSEIVDDLLCRRESKPQRSILRPAA